MCTFRKRKRQETTPDGSASSDNDEEESSAGVSGSSDTDDEDVPLSYYMKEFPYAVGTKVTFPFACEVYADW